MEQAASFIVKSDDMFEFDYQGIIYIASELVNAISSKKLNSPNLIIPQFLKMERVSINKIFKENFEKILTAFISLRFPNIEMFVVKESEELIHEDEPIFFLLHQERKMLMVQYNKKIISRIIDSYLTAISFTSKKFKMGVRETVKSIKRENDELIESILKKNEDKGYVFSTNMSGINSKKESNDRPTISSILGTGVNGITAITPFTTIGPSFYTGRTFIQSSLPQHSNEKVDETHPIQKLWNNDNYMHLHMLMCFYKLIQTPLSKFLADAPNLQTINVTILSNEFIVSKFKIPTIKEESI